MTKECSVNNDQCSTTGRLKRGMCGVHYQRVMNHGGTELAAKPEHHYNWTGDSATYAARPRCTALVSQGLAG
jgi:hypothetical protein